MKLEGYENPDVFPCRGTFTWVPDVPPNIGGINATVGFDPLIIGRGKFRNYYVPTDGEPSIDVSSGVAPEYVEGNFYSPIINATRVLSAGVSVETPDDNNVAVSCIGSRDMLVVSSMSGRLSCIQIEYDLSLWLFDSNLEQYFVDVDGNSTLTSVQKNALQNMRGSGQVDNANLNLFLTGLTPVPVEIVADEEEFPEIQGSDAAQTALARMKSGLVLTRLRTEQYEPNLNLVKRSASSPAEGVYFKTEIFKYTDEERNRNAFPEVNEVVFRAREQFLDSSLVLAVKKTMFFTADRVNFKNQLPCAALGYSMFINGTFYPSFGDRYTFLFPQDSRPNKPNVHVKLFCPDYRIESPGFAHSFNIHVYVVTMPVFLYLAMFPSLLGIMVSIEIASIISPYFGVILGPAPFTKQLVFYGTSRPVSAAAFEASRTAVLPSIGFTRPSGTFELLQDNNVVNTGNIESYKQVVQGQSRFYNTYEYVGTGLQEESDFQTVYYDDYGIRTMSELYPGTLPRTSQFLNAYDILPPGKFTREMFGYQSFVVCDTTPPPLYELFEQTEPCLMFKFNYTKSTNIFQKPGLISAQIKAYTKDKTGLFDTKLVYRVYAVGKDKDPNPMKNRKRTMKIVYGESEEPKLEFSNFDGSWDYNNVLVSSNLSTELDLSSVDVIVNSDQDPFVIASNDFDLYCAIYSVSTLNDNYAYYDLDRFGSLDFPVTYFSVMDDFVLALPIFYKVSYSNGGDIQAQRDFGYTGEYVSDDDEYVCVNTFHSGASYDPEIPYEGRMGSESGFYGLLDMDGSPEGDTSFQIELDAGSADDTNLQRFDFIVNTGNLSKGRINTGDWVLSLVLDEDSANSGAFDQIYAKFEASIYSGESSSFICKITSSEQQLIFVDREINVSLTEHIDIPFYLTSGYNKLILTLYLRNVSEIPKSLKVSRMSLSQNTIQYFKFGTNVSDTGLANIFAYYEDLPIQPTSFVGNCNTFFLKINMPPGNMVIFDPLDGLYIDGVLYSPTWKVALPENMELDYRGVVNGSLLPRATGVEPYQIFFRTGLGNDVRSIDTKKHKFTGLIVTLVNDATSTSEYAVKQIVSEGFARFFRDESYLSTVKSNDNVVELNLQNPTMSSSDELLIAGQAETYDSIKTLFYNLESPGSFAVQPQLGALFMPSDEENYQRIKMKCCPFVSMDNKDLYSYSAGTTTEGCLIFAEDAVVSQQQLERYTMLEGLDLGSDCLVGVSTVGTLYGAVSNNYPGIYAYEKCSIVYYTYRADPTQMFVKIVDGFNVSEPQLVLDLKGFFANYGFTVGDFPGIRNISIAHHDLFPNKSEHYMAFDCGNKVFFVKCYCEQVDSNMYLVGLVNMALVYGDLQSNDEFTTAINGMIGVGAISKLAFSPEATEAVYNADLDGSQRVGIVDFDGHYIGVQFLEAEKIMEVVFDKAFSTFAEVRQIGSLSV